MEIRLWKEVVEPRATIFELIAELVEQHLEYQRAV